MVAQSKPRRKPPCATRTSIFIVTPLPDDTRPPGQISPDHVALLPKNRPGTAPGRHAIETGRTRHRFRRCFRIRHHPDTSVLLHARERSRHCLAAGLALPMHDRETSTCGTLPHCGISITWLTIHGRAVAPGTGHHPGRHSASRISDDLRSVGHVASGRYPAGHRRMSQAPARA